MSIRQSRARAIAVMLAFLAAAIADSASISTARADDQAIARELVLSPEQTQIVAERLKIEGTKTGVTVTTVGRGNSSTLFFVGTVVPLSVPMHEFPTGLTAQVPALTGLKFVRLLDRILIVNPALRVVLAEVGL